MRFIAVRHGESTWNARGMWQGQADPPLSVTGRLQARLVAARLAHETVDALWCSDLSRARATAEIIAATHGLAVQATVGLRERYAGSWQGLTRHEIAQRHGTEWLAYRAHEDPPIGGDGETLAQLHARVADAFTKIVDATVASGSRTVVIVSHGGPCRVLAYLALGLTPHRGTPPVLSAPDNTALAELWSDGRGLRLATYNDAAHLLVRGRVSETALDA